MSHVWIFLEGQVFFLLAVALYMQTRRYSRLAFARALPWFMLYALLAAGHAWSQLWAPGPVHAEVWPWVQVGLFGSAYLPLICAGYHLWPRARHWSGNCAWVVGVGLLLWWAWLIASRPEAQGAYLLARFGLALPAITVTAATLRAHARMYILPLNAPHLYRTLRFSGIAFFLYGLLLLPPVWSASSNLGPASLSFTDLLRLLTLGAFAGGMLRGLDIFEVETRRRLESMELASAVQLARQQWARDLHDNALQWLYAAGLHLQRLQAHLPQEYQPTFQRALQVLQTAQQELRHFLQQAEDQDSAGQIDVQRALTALVQQAQNVSGTSITFHSDNIPPWDARRASHLLAFVQEALSNAIRHGQTPDIEVRLTREGDHLLLEVRDRGRGFNPQITPRGFGLHTMEERARLLGGHMRLESQPGQGTRVILLAPLV